MKHLFSAVVLVAVTAMSVEASPVALDYRATDASCIDASRFADEVSAKLGFVPWSPAAAAKLRVRVEKDGDHFTASFLNTDGTSKIIDGATCAQVTASLAVTVAGAVDPSALQAQPPSAPASVVPAPVAPAPVAPAADDGRIPVTFASVEGRRVDISLQTGAGFGTASNGAAVATAYWEKLCTSPCTARLPLGRNSLMFTDPESRSSGSQTFVIDEPTNIALKHRSRSGARRAWFYSGLGVTAAGVIGGIALGGTDGIVVGSLAASFGVPAMVVPLLIRDSFDATTHSP